VIKQTASSWHPNVFIKAATVKDAKINVILDKNITRFHSKSSGFGNFERTQNTTVFLATPQQTVVLRV
jgi:hypothetical protein